MNPDFPEGNEPSKSPVDILIVEDNNADLMIMQEALLETGLSANLHTAVNGEEAMKFLRRVGDYSTAPRPHLILLDLNMPRKNGYEVLEEIKSDRLLMRIPVVIRLPPKPMRIFRVPTPHTRIVTFGNRLISTTFAR